MHGTRTALEQAVHDEIGRQVKLDLCLWRIKCKMLLGCNVTTNIYIDSHLILVKLARLLRRFEMSLMTSVFHLQNVNFTSSPGGAMTPRFSNKTII